MMKMNADYLKNLLSCDDQGLQALVQAVQQDRIMGTQGVKELLSKYLEESFEQLSNPDLKNENPLLFILLTMLTEDDARIDSTIDRDYAAEAYKSNIDDNRFEHHYFYLKDPLPLIAHLLLQTEVWVAKYDDEMMGVFLGTVSFDEAVTISATIVADILARQDSLPEEKRKGWPNDFRKAVGQNPDDTYRMTQWAATAALDGKTPAERLTAQYTQARRAQQEQLLESYILKLTQTSPFLRDTVFSDVRDKSCMLMVIGPYGSGKTTYINHAYRPHTIATKNTDGVMEWLKEHYPHPSRNQDFHFEAAVLEKTIDAARLSELQAVCAMGAFVDKFRFDRALKSFKAGQHIHIVEITAGDVEEAVIRLCKRENLILDINNSRVKATRENSNAANINRQARIDTIIKHDHSNYPIDYTLLFNQRVDEGSMPHFIEVCKVTNGVLTVLNKELFESLGLVEPVASLKIAAALPMFKHSSGGVASLSLEQEATVSSITAVDDVLDGVPDPRI